MLLSFYFSRAVGPILGFGTRSQIVPARPCNYRRRKHIPLGEIGLGVNYANANGYLASWSYIYVSSNPATTYKNWQLNRSQFCWPGRLALFLCSYRMCNSETGQLILCMVILYPAISSHNGQQLYMSLGPSFLFQSHAISLCWQYKLSKLLISSTQSSSPNSAKLFAISPLPSQLI